MNLNKLISGIGLIGMLVMIYGGFILFDPQSFFGSFFGLIGLIVATLPIVYLWTKTEEVKKK